nr:hypothetical protein [Mycoplasmopsis bovis]
MLEAEKTSFGSLRTNSKIIHNLLLSMLLMLAKKIIQVNIVQVNKIYTFNT